MAIRIDEKYAGLIALFGLLYLTFLVINPLLSALVWAIILTYLFYPLYKKIKGIVKYERASSIILTFAIIIITIVSLTFIINVLSAEVFSTYNLLKQTMDPNTSPQICTNNPLICKINSYIAANSITFNSYTGQGFQRFGSKLIDQTSAFALAIPGKFLEIFIIFFAMYYLFIDGEKLVQKIEALLPLPKKEKKQLIEKITDVVGGVVYGYIITAILVSILMALGLYIFGVKYYVLLGVLTGIASFVPAVSTATIWIPTGIFIFLDGLSGESNFIMLKGIGILLYGFFIIGGADNIVKAKLIGTKSKMHPAIILFGAFGGLYAFGLIGTFIGPIIVSTFVTILESYTSSKS